MRRRAFLAGAAAALPLPAIAQPARARTLRFVPQFNLSVLDPIATLLSITNNHGYYVFDTLFAIDKRMVPRPQMAAGHTVSDDGRTYAITLREGLRFHDGEPVRARDCVASLKRWAARDTLGRALLARLDAWEVADDRTFRIRLKRPFPQLLPALAKPLANSAFIMPERLAATDPITPVTEMVGSGPFRYVADEYVSGSQVVYSRFEGYVPRQEAPEWLSGGKVAYFDRVEWRVIPDSGTAAAALQNGEVDWWEQVEPDLVPLLGRSRNVHLQVGDPSGHIGILRFNATVPPFSSAALRRAVLGAVNQADYMSAVTGGDASAFQTCHSVFPCGTAYGRPLSPDPMQDGPALDAARAAIRAAGYGGEKVVILNPSDSSSIAPFGRITHDLFRRLGMNSELIETDYGSMLRRRASREVPDRGGWSVFHTWWTGLSIANPAVNAPFQGQGDAGWPGWYASQAMETLTERWLDAATPTEQEAAAAEVQALAFQDAPSIPLGQFYVRTAFHRRITGVLDCPSPVPWNVRPA